MIRQLLNLTKNFLLTALLLLPARVALAQGHGHEEYHWSEVEYRTELYLQLGAIAICAILFAVAAWAVKRFRRRTTCKG